MSVHTSLLAGLLHVTHIYSVTQNSQCQHLHCMLHSPLRTHVHTCMHLAPLACLAHPHNAKHLPILRISKVTIIIAMRAF